MIKIKNFQILENESELPNLENADELFLDVETQNNTGETLGKDYGGFYPFLGDIT